jgi:hypothetical protein
LPLEGGRNLSKSLNPSLTLSIFAELLGNSRPQIPRPNQQLSQLISSSFRFLRSAIVLKHDRDRDLASPVSRGTM